MPEEGSTAQRHRVPRRSSTASPARRCRRAAAAYADPGEAGRGGDAHSGRVGRTVDGPGKPAGVPHELFRPGR